MKRIKSLENEHREAEILLSRKRDFLTAYKELIKKLHEVGPNVVHIESNDSKQTCVDILGVLADLRLRDIPAFEKQIRDLRDAVKVKNSIKRSLRSEEERKRIFDNFEKNIKSNKKP